MPEGHGNEAVRPCRERLPASPIDRTRSARVFPRYASSVDGLCPASTNLRHSSSTGAEARTSIPRHEAKVSPFNAGRSGARNFMNGAAIPVLIANSDGAMVGPASVCFLTAAISLMFGDNSHVHARKDKRVRGRLRV